MPPGEVRLGRRNGRARLLYLHGPLFEVPKENGTKKYMAPVPPSLNLETGLEEAVVGEIVADLPDFGIAALMQRTLVPRAKIIKIAKAHEAAQWEAMARDGFAPSCLGG